MVPLGPYGFHPTLLRAVLGTALSPVLSDDIFESSQLRGELFYSNRTAAFGRIEFESAVSSVTEEEPVCFERIAMSSVIRVSERGCDQSWFLPHLH